MQHNAAGFVNRSTKGNWRKIARAALLQTVSGYQNAASHSVAGCRHGPIFHANISWIAPPICPPHEVGNSSTTTALSQDQCSLIKGPEQIRIITHLAGGRTGSQHQAPDQRADGRVPSPTACCTCVPPLQQAMQPVHCQAPPISMCRASCGTQSHATLMGQKRGTRLATRGIATRPVECRQMHGSTPPRPAASLGGTSGSANAAAAWHPRPLHHPLLAPQGSWKELGSASTAAGIHISTKT